MSYRMTDKSALFESTTLQKASIFLRSIAEQIVAASTPKTPMKTGRLRMDVVKQVLGLRGKIIWGKNYAIYQEEKQFKNYTTAGTGPHYAKDAVSEIIAKTSVVARQSGLT